MPHGRGFCGKNPQVDYDDKFQWRHFKPHFKYDSNSKLQNFRKEEKSLRDLAGHASNFIEKYWEKERIVQSLTYTFSQPHHATGKHPSRYTDYAHFTVAVKYYTPATGSITTSAQLASNSNYTNDSNGCTAHIYVCPATGDPICFWNDCDLEPEFVAATTKHGDDDQNGMVDMLYREMGIVLGDQEECQCRNCKERRDSDTTRMDQCN